MSDKMTWEESVSWLRQQPGQADLVKACFYDDPLIEAAERYFNSSEWASVKRYLPVSRGRALDIGAGRGIASYALAKEGFEVTALEPNSSMLVGSGAIRTLAGISHLTIGVEQNWGERMPFADETFEIVHARQVLHHAQDLGQLCSEACRVLKKGGVFIATREHVITRASDLSAFQASHPLHCLYGGEHAYLLAQYKDAIHASGIRLHTIFNPYASDINLYPETVAGLKMRLARKLRLPSRLVPNVLVRWLGAFNNTPGRLYTFIGSKY